MRLRGGQHVKAVEKLAEIPPAPRAPDPRVTAADLLRATDHVEFRNWTPERTPTPEWLSWRETLRDVMRGVVSNVPDEPARYG